MAGEVLDLEVTDSRRISPGFQRVTLRPVDLAAELEAAGYDQWFRMFFADPGGQLHLPYGPAEGWFQRLRAMPEATRPYIRNYTIRRRWPVGSSWQIDVDFVLHTPAGDAGGYTAAMWAMDARPGHRMGFLDQGALYRPGPGPQLIVTDPTGIPGLEAIARSLEDSGGAGEGLHAIAEVDDEEDIREIACDVTWVRRRQGQAHGRAAFEALRDAPVDAQTRAYITGESRFVLEARAHLRERGVPKDAIDFCGYWRKGKRATDE